MLFARFVFLSLAFPMPLLLSAQVPLQGVINHYAAVTAIDTCRAALTVDSTLGFQAGDTVLVIQMKGALVNTGNGPDFGIIIDYAGAGLFEKAVVDAVSAQELFLKHRLLNPFNPAGRVQVVSYPTFPSARVVQNVWARRWDGQKGGVVALRVIDTLRLDFNVLAGGCGFRGGEPRVDTPNFCSWAFPIPGYGFPSGDWRGAPKGEGIVDLPPNLVAGRGAAANGGGGGNDHNTGGGGGANAGAGGAGGINDEPAFLNCQGDFPGQAGKGLLQAGPRLFMGGGGGAGHSNNTPNGGGGAGGGIIILEAGAVTGLYDILSDGVAPVDNLGDGGGGGGAGGSIYLKVDRPNADLTLSVEGARGGITLNGNQQRCFGPGGGGGGGMIYTNNPSDVMIVNGGAPGRVMMSAAPCNNATNTAGAGQNGRVDSLFDIPQSLIPVGPPAVVAQPQSQTACAGDTVVFAVQTDPPAAQVRWQQHSGSGWTDLPNTGDTLSVVTDPGLDGARFRCLVARDACDSVLSGEALLTLQPASQAGFTHVVSQQTVTFQFAGSGAQSYWWTFGDGAASNDRDPEHTYALPGLYAVTLYAIGPCDTAIATQEVVIGAPPTAAFSVPDTVWGCVNSAQVTFANLSSANTTTFQWLLPGGTPAFSSLPQPTVTYNTEGQFAATLIATNALGLDTFSRSFAVAFEAPPLADFTANLLPGGLVIFDNHSVGASQFSWNFGDSTALSNDQNPQHQYTQSGAYTVTLSAVNACGVSVLQQVIEVMIPGAASGQPLRVGAIRLFPNPARHEAWVETEQPPGALRLYAADGRLVWQTAEPGSRTIRLPLQGLPPGVYQVHIAFDHALIHVSLAVGN
ncbi:MAG: PKD domain-containing protein [Saprospiraceae bacterium]|nr:PKD domain-containing protein [Saprospiraceae bacterium]